MVWMGLPLERSRALELERSRGRLADWPPPSLSNLGMRPPPFTKTDKPDKNIKIVNALEIAHISQHLERAVGYTDEIQQEPPTTRAYGNGAPSEVDSFV